MFFWFFIHLLYAKIQEIPWGKDVITALSARGPRIAAALGNGQVWLLENQHWKIIFGKEEPLPMLPTHAQSEYAELSQEWEEDELDSIFWIRRMHPKQVIPAKQEIIREMRFVEDILWLKGDRVYRYAQGHLQAVPSYGETVLWPQKTVVREDNVPAPCATHVQNADGLFSVCARELWRYHPDDLSFVSVGVSCDATPITAWAYDGRLWWLGTAGGQLCTRKESNSKKTFLPMDPRLVEKQKQVHLWLPKLTLYANLSTKSQVDRHDGDWAAGLMLQWSRPPSIHLKNEAVPTSFSTQTEVACATGDIWQPVCEQIDKEEKIWFGYGF